MFIFLTSNFLTKDFSFAYFIFHETKVFGFMDMVRGFFLLKTLLHSSRWHCRPYFEKSLMPVHFLHSSQVAWVLGILGSGA